MCSFSKQLSGEHCSVIVSWSFSSQLQCLGCVSPSAGRLPGAPPAGYWAHASTKPNQTNAGRGTPAHCDAPWGGSRQCGGRSLENENPPKILQSPRETLAKSSQNPPKTLPKPIQNEVRSTHETQEASKKRPRASKKRQTSAQERPNGAQTSLKALQNGALEGPRPHSYQMFLMCCF